MFARFDEIPLLPVENLRKNQNVREEGHPYRGTFMWLVPMSLHYNILATQCHFCHINL